MSRFFGFLFAACLLATVASTGVLAANPDWPKSLTLGTASPGGLYYVYGEALAPILTEKLGIPVNPLPTQGPVHNVKLIEFRRSAAGLNHYGCRPTRLERHRRLDWREALSEHACAVSNV